MLEAFAKPYGHYKRLSQHRAAVESLPVFRTLEPLAPEQSLQRAPVCVSRRIRPSKCGTHPKSAHGTPLLPTCSIAWTAQATTVSHRSEEGLLRTAVDTTCWSMVSWQRRWLPVASESWAAMGCIGKMDGPGQGTVVRVSMSVDLTIPITHTITQFRGRNTTIVNSYS